jgi:hypothetical protein
MVEFVISVFFFNARYGEEGHKVISDANGPSAGSAAAMWGGESFVQIQMHQVGAEISGFNDAHERVKISAVEENQSSSGMNHLAYFMNLFFKDAERVRVCNHKNGDVVIERFLKGLQVNAPVRAGVNLKGAKAAPAGGSGVGAVGGIGNNYLSAALAALVKEGAGNH